MLFQQVLTKDNSCLCLGNLDSCDQYYHCILSGNGSGLQSADSTTMTADAKQKMKMTMGQGSRRRSNAFSVDADEGSASLEQLQRGSRRQSMKNDGTLPTLSKKNSIESFVPGKTSFYFVLVLYIDMNSTKYNQEYKKS